MPFQVPEGHVKIISKIRGKIERCKGLNNTKLLGGSKPYCIVKAIKGNSHLVDLFHTPYGDGKNPQWDASFSYDCTKLRTHEEYVGLKFLVYDGDDFLGGADYDISSLASFREVKEELELAGIASVKSAKGTGLRKPRIWLELTIERRFLPILDPPKEALQKSLLDYTRVKSICGRIVRARGLHGPMGKKSLPMVFVRCYMRSGRIQNMHNTMCNDSWTDPHWDDIFEFDFEDEDDQPLMLIFDIFGSAAGPRAPSRIYTAGDHLGSALLSVASIEDETVFEEGDARQKLPLHGDSQVVEKRIGRDGKHLKMDPWATSKNTEVRVANKTSQGDMYHLTVELFAERTEPLPMKHCELLHTSETIERDDLDDPRFAGDRELEDCFNDLDDNAGKRVRRLTLWAEERIVTVYGRIQAAIDLVAADVMGTSDPYVIVEALTKSGQHIFVYRSAIIPSDLNPTWDEAFYFKVPPDPDNPRIPIQVSKMMFSIYDSDEGQIGNFYDDDSDDFLGRCAVDVSLMRNCDRLCEDIPLLGCKSRPGGFKSHGGYRRYSTLSVEVRVERRVTRLIDVNHELDSNMLLVQRHHESRPMYPPEVKSYKDLSQEPCTFQPLEYDTAGRVLAIRGTTGLLAQARYRKRAGESKMIEDSGWLKRPDLPQMWRTAPAPANLVEQEAEYEYSEGAVDHRRTYMGALQEDWSHILSNSRANVWDLDNINRLSPMSRTASLPVVNPMNVRFGELYEQKVFDPFEDSRKPKAELVRFREVSDNRSLKNLFQKPGTGKVTMRPGRVYPRPACPGGLNCRCGFHHSATQLM